MITAKNERDRMGEVKPNIFALITGTPSISARILVAVIVALAGGLIIHLQYKGKTGFHTDFGMVWFGAKAMIRGENPYMLIGPGRVFDYRWPLLYPATALVAAIPLSVLTEHVAAVIFIAISSGLLAFAVTKNGWHLLPLFLADPFVIACEAGSMVDSVHSRPLFALDFSACHCETSSIPPSSRGKPITSSVDVGRCRRSCAAAA